MLVNGIDVLTIVFVVLVIGLLFGGLTRKAEWRWLTV
jgi:formate hydrogenlyase subunit 4